MKGPLWLLFLMIVGASAAPARQQTLLPDSRIWIEGASNRHAWEAEVDSMTAVVRLGSDEETPRVEAVHLTIPAEQVVSTREKWHERRIMNGLIHRALQTEAHPEIRYELVAVDSVVADGEGFVLHTRGHLTLAGQTHEIAVPVEGRRTDGGTYRFRGEHPLSMRAYGITPPRVRLPGMTLTTRDEATVHFDLHVAASGG